jgi:4-amino-4-deoxy-L-arabinose transferase-like glycosyltransferase
MNGFAWAKVPFRGIPRAAWICALVALLNATCWSFITPPFQGADEDSHFAYTQYLAQSGRLPPSNSTQYASEELIAYRDLNAFEVTRNPAIGTISSKSQQRRLERDLSLPYSRKDSRGAHEAAAEPPLYYALEVIPYWLGSGASLLVRLQLMRLLGALMTAISVLLVYLFLREALPRHRWAWAVGGLGAAFSPLLGFIGGSVNPDVLLITVTCALFYFAARAFRRDLSPEMSIGIGTLTAVGLLTKLNFIGLLPGVTLGLVLLSLRPRATSGRRAGAVFGLTAVIASSPITVPLVLGERSSHSGTDGVSRSASILGGHGVLGELSYIWQAYFPKLPGMSSDFPGISTTFQIWFRGFIGKYNWLETQFPAWAYKLALIPVVWILVLCGRELYRSRTALRSRRIETIVYATLAAGVMAMVAASSYSVFPGRFGFYMEPRYFAPMLALGALVLALAARGAGRWAPAAGSLIVSLSFAHDIFSQLLVVSRYYGPR